MRDSQPLNASFGLCQGPLPDGEMRARMIAHLQSMPGFDDVTAQPWYPGKQYPGIMNRDLAAIRERSSWRSTAWVRHAAVKQLPHDAS